MPGWLPVVPAGMIPTIDPWVAIEEQRTGYIRYLGLDDGRRWEVHGTCAWTDPLTDGPCQQGQTSWPIGAPDGRLDCPITPELDCSTCVGGGHLTFTELPPDTGERQYQAWVRANNARLAGIRVVVPSIDADPIARRALLVEGIRPEVVRCDGDDTAYARLMARLWREGEPFAIVEHDIAPWPGAVPYLFTCPEPWCGYGCADIAEGGLGCVRYGERLLREIEPTWESAHWSELDGLLTGIISRHLRRPGFHRHTPDVAHATREALL